MRNHACNKISQIFLILMALVCSVAFLTPSISAYLCQDTTSINNIPCSIQSIPVDCSTPALIFDRNNPAINYTSPMYALDDKCLHSCVYEYPFNYKIVGNYQTILCDGSYAYINVVSSASNSSTSSLSYREVFSPTSYPYVNVNSSYFMSYKIIVNNVSTNVGQENISINGTNIPFVFNNINKAYELTITFSSIGDFPFLIYGNNSFLNFTGTFLVRQPYSITICGFKADKSVYKNDYAYLTAELTSSKKYYDDIMEVFVTPFELGFIGQSTSKIPVFHTPYSNGCGTFELYDSGEYALRLIDGKVSFKTTFSAPNVTQSYGTNIYLGKFSFTGIDNSYNVLMTNKDIRPYFWLFNWITIGLIILILIISLVLFFMLPQYVAISIGFFFITLISTIVLRFVVWFYIG